MRAYLTTTVMQEAAGRIRHLYEIGEPVLSFSAGKDSGVCLDLMILVAGEMGRLPVKVIMRDEEVMLPGTYEYAERVAERPEVDFKWVYANQPVLNVFNRSMPYFWVFDPLLPPERWVRRPPARAFRIPHLCIQDMTKHALWGIPEDRTIWCVMGLRAQESYNRSLGIFSKRGWKTKRPIRPNIYTCTPIYDWTDGDVWKFIHDGSFDYNRAYDTMLRMGVPANRLRIAPPTMASASMDTLDFARRAFPKWFELVCNRLEGVRTAAMFGRRAVTPLRRNGETWRQCFERLCIAEAPAWIAERATAAMEQGLRWHARHSSKELPEVKTCIECGSNGGSWRGLAHSLYNGDPFEMKLHGFGFKLKYVEPDFFRPGAGKWNGSPSW